MRIAVLEDDESQAALYCAVLQAMGHDCLTFDSGKALTRCMRRDTFDLLILDWCVPDATGYEVLQWVRLHIEQYLPVLFVSNQDEEGLIVSALAAGADDYMVKPITVPQFAARVSALLRRAYPKSLRDPAVFGIYCFAPQHGTVTVNGEPVEMKPREFALAHSLFCHEGQILSRLYLQSVVWGKDVPVSSRSLDTHISRIRQLLRLRPENGFRLSTIYSHGYRLERVSAVETELASLDMLQ